MSVLFVCNSKESDKILIKFQVSLLFSPHPAVTLSRKLRWKSVVLWPLIFLLLPNTFLFFSFTCCQLPLFLWVGGGGRKSSIQIFEQHLNCTAQIKGKPDFRNIPTQFEVRRKRVRITRVCEKEKMNPVKTIYTPALERFVPTVQEVRSY